MIDLFERLRNAVREWGCARCDRMHRRAQEAESAAAKAIRQNDHARLWRTVAKLRLRANEYRRQRLMWRKRYAAMRELADWYGAPEEALRAAVDRADGRVSLKVEWVSPAGGDSNG